MSALPFGSRGRTAIFILISIIAAILFSGSTTDHSQLVRLHPRSLEPEVNATNQYAHLRVRAPSKAIQPASAELYDKSAKKGQVLMCWMRNPQLAGEQATSKWTEFGQLLEWGWRSFGGPPAISGIYATESEPGVKALVGTEWGNGNRVSITHTQSHRSVTEGGRVYYYPATDGNYDNRFYQKQGVIIGDNNWGPSWQVDSGLTEWNKDADRIPELNRLSDIWWLCWAKICSDSNIQPGTLKYMVQKAVVNDDSQAILASVLQKHWSGESEIGAGRAPAWPGKVITKDMDGFGALVGSPNVWGTAYMLVQRSGAMGKKQIKSITAWNGLRASNVYQPDMIIELEDVTNDGITPRSLQPDHLGPEFLTSKDELVHRDELSDSLYGQPPPTACLANPSGPSKKRRSLVVRAPGQPIKSASDAVWKTAEAKGQKLMCWMTDPTLAGDQTKSQWTKYEQLAQWGWTGLNGDPNPIRMNFATEEDPGMKALVGAGCPNGKKVVLQHRKDPAHDAVIVNGQTYDYPATNAEYQNNFYPQKGVIVANYNWGPSYFVQAQLTSKGQDWKTDTDRVPDLNHLSDVWWLLWAEICQNEGVSPNNLQHVIRHNIVNEETNQILARVLRQHWPNEDATSAGKAPAWPGKVITSDMEGFAAILGTSNVWGVPFMLIRRSDVLGKKQVKSITAWNECPQDEWCYQSNLDIELEDVEG